MTHTDPIWWPIFWLNIGALVLAILIAGLGQVVGNLKRRIDRRDLQRLADEAADHGEPSREEIELTWTDEALGRVLAALDETDETWAWANDAIQLANDDTFDRTLAEIRALPTSKESA